MGHFKNIVEIDPDRLREVFKRRNVTLSQAALEMGLNKKYLTNACTKKNPSIGATPAMLMERLYNISREEYEAPQTVVKAEIVEPEPPALDMNELYKTIYSAVYNATKQAYKDM